MSRSSEIFSNIPPATVGIIGLCCSVYACQLVLDLDLHHYTMNPRMVVYLGEYYRFITSTLLHGNLMHIGMNMMSLAAISSMVEKRFGTLRHAMTILWAILLTSSLYTLTAVLLHLILGIDALMYQHAVGFSGVIFHISILESRLSPHRSRSVFGFIRVPSYIYPWALLIALQIFMPNLSFMGHLAGILTGTLQVYGVLNFLMVGEAYLQHMETWSTLAFLTSLPSFVATPISLDSESQLQRDPASLARAMADGMKMLFQLLLNILETILVCIFGRGSESNVNIQLGSWGSSRMQVDEAVDDDDDWVGLPPISEEEVPESRIL